MFSVDFARPPPAILRREESSASTASSESAVTPNKLRFPASSEGPSNLIACKWEGCQMAFKTYGRLSDHLKVRMK